jgi:prepilin-type N-terminal cleavage/methylation domain-containing protein
MILMRLFHIKDSKGVTLVELLVALAVASILMLGVIVAFQTAQNTAAIGEGRGQIYQNARVALDLMSKEIKGAYIDNRNRDFVFISADGLAGRGSSILEFSPNPPGAAPYTVRARGLGNAQTPHGIDPTGQFVFGLYADESFGGPTYTTLSVKAIADIYSLTPGPPDRLDFTCLTGNYPDNTTNQSRLIEVRYCVTTETFVDDVDNDYDASADESDNDPPGSGPIAGLGDLIPMSSMDDLNPETGKITALALFHLRRASDIYVNKNSFSAFDYLESGDPSGRYPARNLDDFEIGNNGENIGSYIYDLQFEFYGRIAIALDDDGSPEVWGVGWGYQDVRGEDVGLLDASDGLTNPDDLGPRAINVGSVSVTQGNATVNGGGTYAWPTANDELIGGIFFVWPSGATEFDVTDSNNDVYEIVDSTSTTITLNRPYAGATNATAPYRIIEPTQANGVLDESGGSYPEDLGADGLVNDPLDNIDDTGTPYASALNIPSNVSDNDDDPLGDETSIGEGNRRLDSRVMGIWDSRSPDPRNPRAAAELNGWDDDDDYGDGTANSGLAYNSNDDDGDGQDDDRLATHYDSAGNLINLADAQFPDYAAPESDVADGVALDESNDLLDDDNNDDTLGDDGIVDDRFYDPAGKPEGVDEPDEADADDDSLPKAVRITIAIRDPQQSLDPVVLSTTVWLSTAR